MNRTMMILIGAAAVVVAAAILAGALFIMDRDAVDSKTGEQTQGTVESDSDNPAPVRFRKDGLVNPRKRPPRVMDSIDRDRARRSLPVPIPTTRDEFNENRRQEKAAGDAQPRPESMTDPKMKHGPRPVEATIQSAARLQAEGRTDDAERLVRNAILTEPNPINRSRLEKELEQIRRASGRKPLTDPQQFNRQ